MISSFIIGFLDAAFVLRLMENAKWGAGQRGQVFRRRLFRSVLTRLVRNSFERSLGRHLVFSQPSIVAAFSAVQLKLPQRVSPVHGW